MNSDIFNNGKSGTMNSLGSTGPASDLRNTIEIFRTIAQIRQWRHSLPSHIKIGFVPTMGALHEGHATLLREARKKVDILVLSIYVNPTQFNDPKDFELYPSTWDHDLAIAKQEGVDIVFNPQYQDIYPDNFKYRLTENSFSHELCGKYRPGHFDGVLTVVMKLFQCVQPHLAFFGEKDFQQLVLIREMTETFFLNTEIVPIPTIREKDGLAMSSRNLRLSPEERIKAPLLYQIISTSKTTQEAQSHLTQNGFRVDYVEDRYGRRFVAAYLGSVRLIDNIDLGSNSNFILTNSAKGNF